MDHQSGQESPRYMNRSREDRKSLSESFVDGTSKFFSSMVAKKNGLISDLSNKIETTFSTKSDRASSSAGSEGSVSPPASPQQPIPNTPPPRPPPPPRRQPSIEAIKQARSSMKRMTSVPAYPAGKGGSAQSRRDSTEHGRKEKGQQEGNDKFSVNGMNISFDEPIYNKPEEPPVPKPLPRKAFGPRGAEYSPGREPVRHSDDKNSTSASSNKSNNTFDSNTNSRSTKRNPFNTSENSYSNDPDFSIENDPNSLADSRPEVTKDSGEVVSPEADVTRSSNRAPKFTTTTRRSSTVDEMLFDDYVPPEEDPVSIPAAGVIPDNLISFEPDSEIASPSSSCSDIDTGGMGIHSDSRKPRTGVSVDSSDAEFGGVVINRSGSLGSEKSWSSNYSLDSQPDDVTLECMEFMKAFVDKIFHSTYVINFSFNPGLGMNPLSFDYFYEKI
ncbi:hypothetical protein PoB_007361700 [Plakobranchus ocellatus]|uniref:WH2 domain-containing protein n=1 Tax=Plakobranchus ocellatus TaxID=259542 RepID=A0AAV4DS27_9GAST|nr:hypothetical protein PoB_007361700 [Plakobranchus ocellatus]